MEPEPKTETASADDLPEVAEVPTDDDYLFTAESGAVYSAGRASQSPPRCAIEKLIHERLFLADSYLLHCTIAGLLSAR